MLLFLNTTIVFLEVWDRVSLFWHGAKGPIFSSCEVSIWLVDVKLPSRSVSRLRNAARCWRGNGRRPYLLGVPDAAALSYSLPIGYPLPRSLLLSASAGVLSISGCSG